MSKLQALLAQHPEEKEEFDLIVELLNSGSVEQIKMWAEYAEVLEEMIEENEKREVMLQVIDDFNHLTEQLRVEGYLNEDTEWWETVL